MNGARIRGAVRRLLPLPVRKGVAVALGRLSFLPNRYWWTMELLRDYAARDPNGFHRFLWSHHLGYAESYQVASRFGPERIHRTRHLLFAAVTEFLRGRGIDPATEIDSVFEVGASLGYLLHHLEERVFPGATRLFGVDIDAAAIASGSAHLAAIGSRVELAVADMARIDDVVGDRRFDVVLCAGVLMYLREEDARAVVAAMLRHTDRYLVIAALAHPERDNRELAASTLRERDGTFVHNVDRMVAEAGGTVRWRRWDGAAQIDGNTVYFLIAEPAGRP